MRLFKRKTPTLDGLEINADRRNVLYVLLESPPYGMSSTGIAIAHPRLTRERVRPCLAAFEAAGWVHAEGGTDLENPTWLYELTEKGRALALIAVGEHEPAAAKPVTIHLTDAPD